MRNTNIGTKRSTRPRKPESFSESLCHRQPREKNGSKDGKKTRLLERVENKRVTSPKNTNLDERAINMEKPKFVKRFSSKRWGRKWPLLFPPPPFSSALSDSVLQPPCGTLHSFLRVHLNALAVFQVPLVLTVHSLTI